MTDTLTARRRSELMGRIRGSGTGPELALRKIAKTLGLKLRSWHNQLPGKPDMVIGPGGTMTATAVFVHGCFWHRCPQHFKLPKSKAGAWREKIDGNVRRDRRVQARLRRMGYRVAVVWEHDLPRKKKGPRLEA